MRENMKLRMSINGRFPAKDPQPFLHRRIKYEDLSVFLPHFKEMEELWTKAEITWTNNLYWTYDNLAVTCYVSENDEETITKYNKKKYPHSRDTVAHFVTHYNPECSWDDTKATKTKENCYIYIIPCYKISDMESNFAKNIILEKIPKMGNHFFKVSNFPNPKIIMGKLGNNTKINIPLEIPIDFYKLSKEQRQGMFCNAVTKQAEIMRELYPNYTSEDYEMMTYRCGTSSMRHTILECRTTEEMAEENIYTDLLQEIFKVGKVDWDNYVFQFHYSNLGTRNTYLVKYTYREIKEMLRNVKEKRMVCPHPDWYGNKLDFYELLMDPDCGVWINRISFGKKDCVGNYYINTKISAEAIQVLNIMIKVVARIKREFPVYFHNNCLSIHTNGKKRKTIVISEKDSEKFIFFTNPNKYPQVSLWPMYELSYIRKTKGYNCYIVKTVRNGQKVFFIIPDYLFNFVYDTLAYEKLKKEGKIEENYDAEDELNIEENESSPLAEATKEIKGIIRKTDEESIPLF